MGLHEPSPVVRAVLEDQRLAVLSTRQGDKPYCNLVCFAVTDDLRCLVFATARNTRKYANLTRDPQVAMLVDNRANEAADVDKATAVTALGTAVEVNGEERESLLSLYVRKHPHLESFASSPATALFRVDTGTYIVVSRFRNVEEISVRP